MKKVSFKVPAYLSNFSSLDNGRTVAKLKMFYIGKTADNREFTKEFAEELIKSLPYCPVVAFYSDVTKDFIGHNSKQYIYGIVTTDNDAHFEKDENGVEWFVCDVMLYTDRIDNIGEIANKIVGHAQSLEMDPNNTEYESFVDENGHRGIRFTKGSLVGLSVLGENQNPAFTGSEFFNETEFSDMRERFENFFSCLENNSRGEQMEKEQFTAYANFYRLSYTDKMKMAAQTLLDNLGDMYDACILDMDDNTFTAEIFSFETWSSVFKRFNYTLNEAEFSLGEGVEVFRKLLSAEEIKYLEGFASQPVTTEMSSKEEEESKKDEQPEPKKEEEEEEPKKEEEMSAQPTEEPVQPVEETPAEEPVAMAATPEEQPAEEAPATPVENCAVEPEKKENKDEEEDDEEPASKKDEDETKCSSNTSTLSDSERNELEAFRTKAKFELVESYNGMLPKETLEAFTSKINEYDFAKLEVELALEFSKYSKTHKGESTDNVPLSFSKIVNSTTVVVEDNSYAGLVQKMLNK